MLHRHCGNNDGRLRFVITLGILFFQWGCGGGNAQYTIGGQISGLSPGQTITLQNNGGHDLILAANGGFVFSEKQTEKSTYAISIAAQPTQQNCSVENASGTVPASDVSNIVVQCVASMVTVSGSVSGLAIGQTFTLQLNGANSLDISNNDPFKFSATIQSGTAYDVAIIAPPAAQTCSVNKGMGTASKINVVDIAVVCSDQAYRVGGSVSGLTGGGLILANNLKDILPRSSAGTFTFPAALAVGADYNVTVAQQPTGQFCTVTGGAGTISSANVSNVNVACVAAFTVGGTVSGLVPGGTIVLKDNGGEVLTISKDGAYSFSTLLENGAAYNVVILSSPSSQICTVSNGSGTLANAHIRNVNVNCGAGRKLGGTVIGLSGKGLVLQSNSGEKIAVSGTGEVEFQFSKPLSEGSVYSVTVAEQPTSPAETCSVSNGTGTLATRDVTNIIVDCPFAFSWSQPKPQGNAVRRIRVLNNQLVIAADSGAVLFGDLAGAQWTLHKVGAFAIRGITWTGAQYVVVGALMKDSFNYEGVVYTSSDGASWTQQTIPAASPALNDVTWTGSALVAVGDAGTILTSTNGINWTKRTAPTANNLYSIATGGNFAVAVGRTTIIASDKTGVGWLQVRSGTGWEMYGVGFAKGQFIAVGDGSGTVIAYPGKAAIQYSAVNSVTSWTTVSPAGVVDLEDVAHDGQKWIAVGLGGTVATSTDGANWTTRTAEPTNPMSQFQEFYSVVWNGAAGKTMLAGAFGKMLQSADGVNWTKLDSSFVTSGINELIWTGDRAIAVAGSAYPFNSKYYAESVLISSTDGSGNWQLHATVTQKPIRSVAVYGSKWVTVGDGGEIEYSFDNGLSWTLVPSVTTSALYAVRHNGKYFIAAGEKATLLTSGDGANWTPRTVPTVTNTLSSIATIGTRTVVVGAGGIVTSDNGGDTWMYRGSSPGNHVVAAGTLLLLYKGSTSWSYDGYGNSVYTSTDGIDWLPQSLPTSNTTQRVVWTGKTYLAFVSIQNGPNSPTPAILESYDAKNWNLVNKLNDFSPYFGVTTMTSLPGSRLLIGSGGATIMVGQ